MTTYTTTFTRFDGETFTVTRSGADVRFTWSPGFRGDMAEGIRRAYLAARGIWSEGFDALEEGLASIGIDPTGRVTETANAETAVRLRPVVSNGVTYFRAVRS